MNSADNTIQTLEWYEHIRLNPEMYIGKIGDGSDAGDGIYTLLKRLIDSSADEFEMGYAKGLEIEISGLTVSLREYGRGIPLESVVFTTSGISVGIGARKDVVTTNSHKVLTLFLKSSRLFHTVVRLAHGHCIPKASWQIRE